ncbi:MAG TPA: TRAP transporter small permease subunit, partial [Candidatus Eisenbacteria bacterium]|nr:TRAP transporter small permease subunit [Candidatus Eisenbacteria bacterium]
MLARAGANVVEGLLLLMMVVLCADVFLGVFSRYVIGRTFTWYDEIARLLFVWIVFLGAAVGVRRTAHFRLHLLVDRFPPGVRRVADVFGVLVLIG